MDCRCPGANLYEFISLAFSFKITILEKE